MIDSNTEFVISLKNASGINQITGKNAIIRSVNVNQPIESEDIYTASGALLGKVFPGTVDVTLEMTCLDTDLVQQFFDSDYKPPRKISELKVNDCSIEELFFAVRSKINGGER